MSFKKFSHPRAMFMMWINSKQAQLGTLIAVVPLFILWLSWNDRNNSKHNGVRMKATRIIKRTHHLVESLLKVGIIHVDRKRVTYPIAVTWKKSKDEWTKLNRDGALKGCGLATGSGVIRKKLGDVTRGFMTSINDVRKVWVEVHSSAAMSLCIQQNKGHWDVQYILESIHQNVKTEVQFSHIWSERNKLAYWFANKGYTEKCFKMVQGIDLQGVVRGFIRMDKLGIASIRLVERT
ncbi:Ribonuclease H-like protein [Abeliophyllum distichum]|uniref:Ribonuclease H-like protein n=1 Tax=Abeliophyllum distichum TaxID=126358 RepID=A0ABD1TXN3_9LAMI